MSGTWKRSPGSALRAPGLLLATPYRIVDVTDAEAEARATSWWEELTGRGGEGMVVKPLEFIARGRRGLVQPAVKCRGREYLRIIYGPEYTLAREPRAAALARPCRPSARWPCANLRWASRGWNGSSRREPLRRVHECVFGVLALESEPVDPRL